MITYAKLLIEGLADAELFDVVSVPRAQLGTIVTQESDPVTDGSGQTEPIPINWANYLIVEANDWTQAHTDAINNAVAAYNAKYPLLPIPGSEVMIWNQ